MKRTDKVFQAVVLGGLALATASAGCSEETPPTDASVPRDTSTREGPDVLPPLDLT
jgi:hypothetical protein